MDLHPMELLLSPESIHALALAILNGDAAALDDDDELARCVVITADHQ